MRLLVLENLPIFEQLRLEEALLRASQDSWCLVNMGSPPAIVMGISGRPEKLVHLEKVRADKIPLIKRFSGGGTVYIDEKTLFVTLICNQKEHSFPPQPAPIMKWTESLYAPLFPGFSLRENDYVFGEHKFGGNAQYIQKGRWLHHTSFLWDFSPAGMEYLRLPEKRPQYRQDRSHTDFLRPLLPLFPEKQLLLEATITHLKQALSARLTPLQEAQAILRLPHRTSTTLVLSP